MNTTNDDKEEKMWLALSAVINKRELNRIFPNGSLSFFVRLKRKDHVTMQLLKAAGLL